MPGPKDDGKAPRAEDVAAGLLVLSRVAEDRTVLAAFDEETRRTLQKLAGEVARPDLRKRKKLQKALLRREHAERKARDEALRRDTGIKRLRAAPVFA